MQRNFNTIPNSPSTWKINALNLLSCFFGFHFIYKFCIFLFSADVLLFLKYYDPAIKQIAYVGHVYLPIRTKIRKHIPPKMRLISFKITCWSFTEVGISPFVSHLACSTTNKKQMLLTVVLFLRGTNSVITV